MSVSVFSGEAHAQAKNTPTAAPQPDAFAPQTSPLQESTSLSPKQQTKKFTLSQERYKKAIAFSHAWYTLYFLRWFCDLFVLILVLRLGVAAKLRDLAEHVSRSRLVHGLVFIPILVLTLDILDLPFRIEGHLLSVRYGQSIQRWSSWLWDWSKGAALETGFVLIMAMVLYALIRRTPRLWWFHFWIISLPILVTVIFIGPWFIDPLFYKFEPLSDKHPELVAEIEEVAQRADLQIPPEHIFSMAASEKTKQINALITGLGASKHVVIWDTLIEKTTTPELLFVFGHEAAHYKLGYVRDAVLFYAGLLFAGLYVCLRTIHWTLRRWGNSWKIRSPEDWASFAVFLLLLHVGTFLTLPVENAFSRMQEHAADVFAQEVLHGIVPHPDEVAADAFQVLGEVDLADPDPPPFIVFWLYSHPPLAERLAFAQSYDPWSKGRHPKYIK